MNRGRGATAPHRIPGAGMVDVGYRLFVRLGTQNVGLLAAGIAYYGLLSVFPGITAMVAIAARMTDPDSLVDVSEMMTGLMPAAVQEILLGQLTSVVSADDGTLNLAAGLSLALALFSASRAVENFITGLNVIYDEKERRGFLKLKLLTLFLTLGMILFLLAVVIIVGAIPAIAAFVGGRPWLTDVLMLVRWPLLFTFGVFGIAILYRYGPSRRPAKWRWLTPGAVLACSLWVAGSWGFSKYVQSFGSYNETFGTLGGVIVLLTWMWLSAFTVLFGAQLDAELEAQTARDSTVGDPKPMGERGAVKADTLGKSLGEESPEALEQDPALTR